MKDQKLATGDDFNPERRLKQVLNDLGTLINVDYTALISTSEESPTVLAEWRKKEDEVSVIPSLLQKEPNKFVRLARCCGNGTDGPKDGPYDKNSDAWKRTMIMAVPVPGENDALGVLVLVSKKPRRFSEFAYKTTFIVASILGWALEDALRCKLVRKNLEAVQAELVLAQKAQENLLPQYFPELEGLEVTGRSIPAQVVGGDYFDFLLLEGGRLVAVIGDVMGKGMAAATLMFILRSTLRAILSDEKDLSRVLSRLNSIVGDDLRRAGAFATFCILVFEPYLGRVRCYNAGHHYPLFYKGGKVDRLITNGIALGLHEKYIYKDSRVLELSSDDVVLLYTDGLVEARNQRGEKFGLARLKEVLQENAGRSAAGIQEVVIDAVKQFAGDTSQKDDITLAVIKVR